MCWRLLRAENARIKEVRTEQQIMMDEYQNEHVSRDLMEATIQAEIEKLNQRRQGKRLFQAVSTVLNSNPNFNRQLRCQSNLG